MPAPSPARPQPSTPRATSGVDSRQYRVRATQNAIVPAYPAHDHPIHFQTPMSPNQKEQSPAFDSVTYARSAERLMRALEIAYETPAAHADELCEAVRVFV